MQCSSGGTKSPSSDGLHDAIVSIKKANISQQLLKTTTFLVYCKTVSFDWHNYQKVFGLYFYH